MSALSTPSYRPTPRKEAAQPTRVAGLRFDWLMALLSLVFVGGLYLDGWAHNHGRVDQSFFTPWHAFFYGGFLLTALALTGGVLLNWRRGFALADAIPTGYRSSLAALFVFAAGGVGDLAWHNAFGIEEDVEALFSPTHLLLGIGLALIVTGPLRSAWHSRQPARGWRSLGPALLSLSLFISVLTFFLLYAHPVTQVVAGAHHRHYTSDLGIVAGMMGLISTTAVLLGPVLLALRRWHLPPGSLTLVWGLNTLGMTAMDYEFRHQLWMGGAMLAAALLCDGLLLRLRPAIDRPDRLRLFAFAAPVLLFGAYFAALMATEGTRWSIHLWAGSIFITGIVGLLLSYLLAPPPLPAEIETQQ